ncbi:transposase [Embleya sp. NPDC050154]|uniref:transposase n=1 Tax=Embleya sp. NPDC050154 TaxID=3363988 RepID=UPI00379AA889
MPKHHPRDLKERAVRLLLESRDRYKSEHAAIRSIAAKLDVGPESLRHWVRRAEVDSGHRPGTTTEESAQLKALKKENAELKRANEILKAAASFFTAELDRPHTRS